MKKTKFLSLLGLVAISLSVGACSSSEEVEKTNTNFTPSSSYAALEENETKYLDQENSESLECEHDFGDTYSIDQDDSRFHVQTCSICGYQQKEAHQVDTEEGNCIHCDATGLNTAGITYAKHSSEYYVKEYDMSLKAKELYIPATYEGLPVTRVGNGGSGPTATAFGGDTTGTTLNSLQFVSLPSSITRVSDYGFYDCYSLQYVYIPEGVTRLGDYSFYYCQALQEVVLPSTITKIGIHAFEFCTALKSINIPEGVTEISSNAFYTCEALEKIVLPESVTTLSSHAFTYCTSLQSINIPETVTSFGDGLFQGCVALEHIEVPDTVTDLGHYTFQYCCSLKSINIPYGVSKIGISTFDNCSSLEYIVLPETCTSLSQYSFWQDFSIQYIVFPKSLTSVDGDCFAFNYSLSHVFYGGNEDDWNNVKFTKPYNEYIQNANIYYYDEDGSLKTEDSLGNYWHYNEEGEIAIW